MRLFLITSIASVWSLMANADCPKIEFAKEFPVFRTKVPKLKSAKLTEKFSTKVADIPLVFHFPVGWQAGPGEEGIVVQPDSPICMSRETIEPDGEVYKDCLEIYISVLTDTTPEEFAKSNATVSEIRVPHKTWKDGKVSESSFNSLKGFEDAHFSRVKNNCAADASGYFLVKGMTLRIAYSNVRLGKKSFGKETAMLFEILKHIEIGAK
jgi:hypothetical protein